MGFYEGETFFDNGYSWQIDHLQGVPAKIQTVLYFGKKIIGLWRFKPNSSKIKIMEFMHDRVVQIVG